jgi:hypothetical protein
MSSLYVRCLPDCSPCCKKTKSNCEAPRERCKLKICYSDGLGYVVIGKQCYHCSCASGTEKEGVEMQKIIKTVPQSLKADRGKNLKSFVGISPCLNASNSPDFSSWPQRSKKSVEFSWDNSDIMDN